MTIVTVQDGRASMPVEFWMKYAAEANKHFQEATRLTQRVQELENERDQLREQLAASAQRRIALERERDKWKQEWEAMAGCRNLERDEVIRAEARIETLERALREAETLLTNYLVAGKFPPGSDCEEVRDIALAALDGKEEEV